MATLGWRALGLINGAPLCECYIVLCETSNGDPSIDRMVLMGAVMLALSGCGRSPACDKQDMGNRLNSA